MRPLTHDTVAAARWTVRGYGPGVTGVINAKGDIQLFSQSGALVQTLAAACWIERYVQLHTRLSHYSSQTSEMIWKMHVDEGEVRLQDNAMTKVHRKAFQYFTAGLKDLSTPMIISS